MSSNFSIDTLNKEYQNKIDIYKDTVKKILQIKKDINNFKKITLKNNNKEINSPEYNKTLIELENSYKNSLILLRIMKKKMAKTILEKYNIEKDDKTVESNDNNEVNQSNEVNESILIKKNF